MSDEASARTEPGSPALLMPLGHGRLLGRLEPPGLQYHCQGMFVTNSSQTSQKSATSSPEGFRERCLRFNGLSIFLQLSATSECAHASSRTPTTEDLTITYYPSMTTMRSGFQNRQSAKYW